MSDAKIDFYANPHLVPSDVKLRFGGGGDAQLVWSTADADNHSLVLALGDSSQALHVTDVGGAATDWNVSADTHPALYVHSNTTPSTDYIKIGGHDGTMATIDVAGGTTLTLAIAGTPSASLTSGMLTIGTGDGTIAAPNDLILQADEDSGDAGSRIQFRTDGGNAGNFTGNDFTVAGSITAGTSVTGDTLLASANDSGAIGASGTAFSDLFLASGAVINFDAGNAAITHGSGFLNFSAGKTFINEVANANMTVGLTINQGANDNQILALKSSDINTGLTTAPFGKDVEVDDFFTIEKASATLGGVLIHALAEDGVLATPFEVESFGGTASTTKTTAAEALVMFTVAEHNGANALANITANGNVLSLRARVGGNMLARFLIDEDGDMYSATTGQTFDDYDDGALLEAYDRVRSGDLKSAVKTAFGDLVEANEAALVDLGILGAPMKDDPLTNWTQLCRVLTGAVRQQRVEIKTLQSRLLALEAG